MAISIQKTTVANVSIFEANVVTTNTAAISIAVDYTPYINSLISIQQTIANSQQEILSTLNTISNTLIIISNTQNGSSNIALDISNAIYGISNKW